MEIFRYLDTDSLHKLTTTHKAFYATWLIPRTWEHVESEEEYFDTRIVELLSKHSNQVLCFKAKYEYEFEENPSLNSILFSMYNVVKLNLSGCKIIHNVDFLQIMYQLRELNLSECPGMSTSSLIRSVPTLSTLRDFICRGNDVRVTAFSIYRCVRDLSNLQLLDMCDSGTMRPWLARKLCRFCTGLQKFYFTTYWSLDTDLSKVSWYKLVRRKYPHIEFTQQVLNKVSEYESDCRAVRMEARLDEWADEANVHNPL